MNRGLPIASLAVVLLATLTLAGCAARVHMPFVPDFEPGGPTLAAARTSEFDVLDHTPRPSYAHEAEDAAYRIETLAFPSVGENGQEGNLVTARHYRSKGKGAKPLVIILPIWGIHAYPSNAMSAGLREYSAGALNVLQILGEEPLLDWDAISNAQSEAEFFDLLEQMIGRFVSTVIDIRRAVDWAQSQPDVDPERIALIGFSMGALVASVAVANEPRLAAGVLVMGGADPHEILAACDHEIEDARERVLAQLDWSLDQFKSAMQHELAGINPARFLGMADPSQVLIIEAAKDTCVPKSARDRLWHAFGRPERIAYLYDHRTAFLAMTFLGGYSLQRQVYRFLDGALVKYGDRLLLTQAEGWPGRGSDPG
jgi:dienelactone hydrolase